MTRDADEQHQVLWLQGVANGDRHAFQQLFKCYEADKGLWRYLYRMLNQDAHLADDLFSEVMFAVWKNAASFKGDSKPSTWIFGIAYHKVMTLLRKKLWNTVSLDQVRYDPPANDLLENEEDKKRSGRFLRQAIESLSSKHRAVVHLYLQEFSYKEIAVIVRCNQETVKTRMFHARKQLKMKLIAMGFTDTPLP